MNDHPSLFDEHLFDAGVDPGVEDEPVVGGEDEVFKMAREILAVAPPATGPRTRPCAPCARGARRRRRHSASLRSGHPTRRPRAASPSTTR